MLKNLFGWLLAFGITVFSWSQLLSPPIIKMQEGMNPRVVLAALLDPTSEVVYENTPVGGWAFIAVSFALILLLAIAARGVLRYLAFSRTAISVLSTKLTLSFDDPSLHRATIHRTQFIHANRAKVQAYKSSVTTTQSGASMDVRSMSVQSEVNGVDITERVINVGNHTNRDVIEIFKKPLKLNPFVTYLPNDWVMGLRRLFKGSIVERTSSIVQIGEFDHADAHFAVNAIRYPVTDVVVNVIFPQETAPEKDDIRAFLISDNAARTLDVLRHVENDKIRYCIKQASVVSSTILLTWPNTKLMAWKAAQPTPAVRTPASKPKPAKPAPAAKAARNRAPAAKTPAAKAKPAPNRGAPKGQPKP